MPEIRERTLSLPDVDLHLLESGDDGAPVVVLAHGFPDLAYAWRHQLPTLAAAGYRVVAPEQRGYGRSSRPEPVEAYDVHHLAGDLVAIVDDLGAERAVFVGHDWGSMVVSSLVGLHPDRVAAIVNCSVPFLPRPAASPIETLKAIFGDAFFYMLYFQEPGVADADLGRDTATTMRRMLGGVKRDVDAVPDPSFFANDGRGFVDRLPEPEGRPPWLGQDVLDHYVEAFTRTGFTGPVNWYRNLHRNWETTEQLAGLKVEVPSLFISGALDPVLLMSPPANAHPALTDHRGDALVDDAGHWVQQERPAEFDAPLLEFLAGIDHGGSRP